MIALHYAATANNQQQQGCDAGDNGDFNPQIWTEGFNDLQQSFPARGQINSSTSGTNSCSNNNSPAHQRHHHINKGSGDGQQTGCDPDQYHIFGIQSDDSETNDYQDSIINLRIKKQQQQVPTTCLPIAEDNKELKRLIEDNYLYYKKQTGNLDAINQMNPASCKFSALSETDFIRMKNGENRSRNSTEGTKKSFALSDSEFLKAISETKSKKKHLEALKEGAIASTKTNKVKEEKGFNFLSLLAKTKRSSTECFSIEKKRHQATSEEIRTSRTQLFRRSRNRKLSHSYNGAIGHRQSKKEPTVRQLSDTDSDTGFVYLPRMLSESTDSNTNRFTTPDILLDINILTEIQQDSNGQSGDILQTSISDIPSENVTSSKLKSTTTIQLIDLGANTIQEVSNDDLTLLAECLAESPLVPATPPPSISPSSIVDSSIPLAEQKALELSEKSNVLITSSTDLVELFRSLSFPISEQKFSPPSRQLHSSISNSYESKRKSPQHIKQRLSTLSDQVLVTRNSTNFLMSPPATPNFNSAQNLPTKTTPQHANINSLNVYFLSPPPSATNGGNQTANQFLSDTSTVSLDVMTTLPIPQHQHQTTAPPNFSPKPEIILDSTLSPTSMHSGGEGSPTGEDKDFTSPLFKRHDSEPETTHTTTTTASGRHRSSLLTGYEGIQTVRKRQASVVTYDVNVINFSQENSDSRSYIPMGRVSTSSASKLILLMYVVASFEYFMNFPEHCRHHQSQVRIVYRASNKTVASHAQKENEPFML